MSEIDPKEFGELCSNVKHIKGTVDEVKTDLKEHKDKTENRLDQHDSRIVTIETEKKWLYRVFGSGALGTAVYNWIF